MSHVLARLKANDAGEQAAFWRAHRPTVAAIARDILGRGDEADDLADEVLVDFLYNVVHRIEHEEAIKSYLRLMTVRRAFRRKRREDRTRPLVVERKSEADHEDAVGLQLLMPRLERCLQVLTPKARQALTLRFRGEMTNEHIGTIVGGSKQYIGRLLTKSLAALRACIEKEGVEHGGESSPASPSK